MITKNTIRALGVFANSKGIEQAINELKTANFPMEKVSVIAKDVEQGDRVGETQISDRIGAQDVNTTGAVREALTASTWGSVLVGLSSLALPGLGAVLAASSVGVALVSSVAGVAVGAAANQNLLKALGDLIALRYALSNPERVPALVLVDSMGFSQFVNPIMSNLTLPWYGELAIAWSQTPLGAKQRAWSRAALLFANPLKVPNAWLAEQERLGLVPGFLEANLSILRSQVYVLGQHQVVLESLPKLEMPTLVVWGINDLVLPNSQAQDAVSRLKQGHLALIPNSGHLPQVERPELFTDALNQFLAYHL